MQNIEILSDTFTVLCGNSMRVGYSFAVKASLYMTGFVSQGEWGYGKNIYLCRMFNFLYKQK